MSLDTASIRAEFPFLREVIAGRPVVYLDSAATAQKPLAVLEVQRTFDARLNANVHRSLHPLSEVATTFFEKAREAVRRFINAPSAREVIVTKGATEAINIVARGYGEILRPRDRVAVTRLEHHSNIVPWQMLSLRGIEVTWIDVDDEGNVRMDQLERVLDSGSVKVVAVTGQSNVLGIRPDLRRIIDASHAAKAAVVVDAAQWVAHDAIDVQALGCDFLAFSGHKVYAPGGVGVLWGREELLRTLPPLLGGGMMIAEVRDDDFTLADLPAKFEAGTPPASAFVGLGGAIEWLEKLPRAECVAHERALIDRAVSMLGSIPGVRVLGPADPSLIHGCVSFVVDGVHAHDLTHLLGDEGFCLRAGHHCAQPLHRRLGVQASSRMSVALYNTIEEIDALGPVIERVVRKLK